jgi:hypothetical protein
MILTEVLETIKTKYRDESEKIEIKSYWTSNIVTEAHAQNINLCTFWNPCTHTEYLPEYKIKTIKILRTVDI